MDNKKLLELLENQRKALSMAILHLKKANYNKKNYTKAKTGKLGTFIILLRRVRLNESVNIPTAWYLSVITHLKKYNKLHKFHIDTENNFTKIEDWNDPKLNDV